MLKLLGIIISFLSIFAYISLKSPYNHFAPVFILIIISLGLIIYGIGHLISILENNKK